MSQKTSVSLGMIIGSFIGGYAPTYFGVSVFSFTSILLTAVGGFLGIVIAWKLSDR